jgi:hypothetical protein
MSSAESEAHANLTNGPPDGSVRRWISRAINSRPVPDSPLMITWLRDAAARTTWSSARRIAGDEPKIGASNSSVMMED